MIDVKIRNVFEKGILPDNTYWNNLDFNNNKIKIPIGTFCKARCYYCYMVNL